MLKSYVFATEACRKTSNQHKRTFQSSCYCRCTGQHCCVQSNGQSRFIRESASSNVSSDSWKNVQLIYRWSKLESIFA